jgi:chromosome segregation ATPase
VAAPASFAANGNNGKEKLRKAVEQTRKACSNAKDSSAKPGKAHKQQCAKAAQRLLGALKQAEQRVRKLQEKLSQVAEARCGTTAAAGTTEKCDKLRQRLERLATLGTKLQAAIEKLESRIGKAGESQSTQDVQVSDEEIGSVDELAQELAATGK